MSGNSIVLVDFDCYRKEKNIVEEKERLTCPQDRHQQQINETEHKIEFISYANTHNFYHLK